MRFQCHRAGRHRYNQHGAAERAAPAQRQRGPLALPERRKSNSCCTVRDLLLVTPLCSSSSTLRRVSCPPHPGPKRHLQEGRWRVRRTCPHCCEGAAPALFALVTRRIARCATHLATRIRRSLVERPAGPPLRPWLRRPQRYAGRTSPLCSRCWSLRGDGHSSDFARSVGHRALGCVRELAQFLSS